MNLRYIQRRKRWWRVEFLSLTIEAPRGAKKTRIGKDFRDSAYGGKRAALRAALAWRDRTARRLKRMVYLAEGYRCRTYEAAGKRLAGVALVAHGSRTGQIHAFWRITLGRKKGPRSAKGKLHYRLGYVSIREHGYVDGFRLAARRRFKAIGVEPRRSVPVPIPRPRQRRVLSHIGISAPFKLRRVRLRGSKSR